MEKDDEENQKIHFCLPVCGNVCQHVSVCRLSEKGGNNRKKEKTDRNVTDLVENTRKILENNEKSNCILMGK